VIPKNRIREYRTKINLTQEELARVVEMSHATVSRHESCDRGLTRDAITKYCKAFKIDSFELFFVTNSDGEIEV